MNKVYITECSSISSLGIGRIRSISNLYKGIQPIIHPGKNDKYIRPYFSANHEFNYKKDTIRSSLFTLKILELTKKSWQDFLKIPLFISTSTGGITETENNYLDIVHNSLKYPVFEVESSIYEFGTVIPNKTINCPSSILSS